MNRVKNLLANALFLILAPVLVVPLIIGLALVDSGDTRDVFTGRVNVWKGLT